MITPILKLLRSGGGDEEDSDFGSETNQQFCGYHLQCAAV